MLIATHYTLTPYAAVPIVIVALGLKLFLRRRR